MKQVIRFFTLLLIFSVIVGTSVEAETFTARVNGGNWNASSTWIKSLTGIVSNASLSTAVTGTGTLFETELVVGDTIRLADGTPIGRVASIASNTSLTLSAGLSGTKSGAYGKEAVPGTSDDIVIALGANQITVTANVNATCASLTINAPTGNNTNQLNIGAVTLTVTGNVAINGGSNNNRISKLVMSSGSSVLEVEGNITIGNGGSSSTAVLDLGGGSNLASTLKVKGSLSRNTADGSFTPGTGSTVDFNGTAGQTINIANFTYANVRTNNTHSSGASLGGAVTASDITGNLRVQSGTFGNSGNAIALANNKAFDVDSGATFKMTGTSVMVTGTGLTKTFHASSTVEYGGSSQNVSAETYGHLTISGSGTKTPQGATTANGNFTISAGTFTASAAANTLNVKGNFTNNGSFTHGSTRVTLSGTSAQAINGSSSTAFNKLTVTNTAGAINVNTSLTCADTLNLNGANTVLNPAAAVTIGGGGRLTGTGTAKVTRISGGASHFLNQYTITNKTLTNLTVEMAGGAAQDLATNTFGGLKINTIIVMASA